VSADGKFIMKFGTHKNSSTSVAWSPTGEHIVSTSKDQTAIIWDAQTGALLHTLNGHKDWVKCASFSPDGAKIATCGDDGAVLIWDATAGKLLHRLADAGPVPSYHAADSGSDGGARRAVSVVVGMPAREKWVNTVAWGPDGDLLVSGRNDASLVVWAAATGRAVARLVGHLGAVTAVAWAPDGSGRIASASCDETVAVWEPSRARPLALAMALHPRLGRGSALRILGEDILRAVACLIHVQWGDLTGDP
jgi:WD40 repeat protein